MMNRSGIGTFFLCIICAIIICAGCDNNPVDDSGVSGSPNQITGQVVLENGASPESVFVWLKNYNLGSYTDNNGNFLLTLPGSLSNASTGIQFDTLYFYLSNYLLETAQVMLIDGELAYDRGDLDAQGKVREPIVMHRFLQISTTVQPVIISHDAPPTQDTIRVVARLRADDACVQVNIAKMGAPNRREDDGPLGAALIRRVGSAIVEIIQGEFFEDGANYLVPICQTLVQRDLNFTLSSLSLEPGTYEIFPFVITNPEGVPQSLLEKIGIEVNELNSNFLKKPMRLSSGQLIVQ